uniref:Uncharacterized protein n=1 Tax=Hemiselmis andersenii TaxID=464988 RepID=A0A6T8LMD2_HEMAN|mmetsp:Transcript_20770/g.47962  ORF Transcript_20770/g.47962 Transcript_20770/m.47962 type:complete len:217 (+) Transcript_20770:84-734(+)
MRLFGKKEAKGPEPSPAEAIMKLKEAEEMLFKRQQFQQTKIDKENALAKEKVKKKDRAGAATHLKKRKLYEKALDVLDKQLMNLRTQIETLENAAVAKEVFDHQKVYAAAMKGIHKDLTTDKVEEQMMDVQEQMDIHNEIQDALTQSLPGAGVDLDEDELFAELDEMEQQDMDEQLLATEETPLPSVPMAAPKINAPAAKMSEEDEELAQLMADMS